jgi:hypothetical protein
MSFNVFLRAREGLMRRRNANMRGDARCRKVEIILSGSVIPVKLTAPALAACNVVGYIAFMNLNVCAQAGRRKRCLRKWV